MELFLNPKTRSDFILNPVTRSTIFYWACHINECKKDGLTWNKIKQIYLEL